MANQQAASNDGFELRRGALTKHGELVSFVANSTDDGERWNVRTQDDILVRLTVYPEDVTGYSKRLYV